MKKGRSMTLKKITVLLIAIGVFVLASCGETSTVNSNDSNSGEQATDGQNSGKKQLSKEEFEKIFSDPKKYKGSSVDFFARIFVEPERDEDGTYLQAYANDLDSQNVIIMIEDSTIDVEMDDIIHVTGIIKDKFKGENAFGGQVTAPLIHADSIEKSNFQTAFAPALATIEVDEEQNQHGYILRVDKVELAEKETRVYVKVTNNSEDKINFYSFNGKLIVDGKQLEEETNYEANYPEVQSEVLPGVSTDGIITFPAIANDIASFQLYFEGSSDNWELDIKPFNFTVNSK